MSYQIFWHHFKEASPGNFLSQDERIRLTQYNNPQKAQMFERGRNWLRFHLSEKLGEAPRSFEIQENENGKPYLSGEKIYFNISHSSSYLLIGLSQFNIGVDIEEIKSRTNMDATLQRFFHPSCLEKFKSLKTDEAHKYFYQLWVAYESLAKCKGTGVFGTNPFKAIAADKIIEPKLKIEKHEIVWEKSPDGLKAAVASEKI